MAGARGEAVIEVPGGEPVTILFTNRALADAERATGKSVLDLAREAGQGRLGMADTAQLLYVGMEAARRDARVGGRAYNVNDAYAVLDAVGYARVAAPVMEAIAAVLAFEAGGEEGDNPPA